MERDCGEMVRSVYIKVVCRKRGRALKNKKLRKKACERELETMSLIWR